MNNYIEKVFNSFIPDNKGYLYIGAENLFIPVYRVTLSVTKRKQTRLNLVEEMVLKIVDCGVTELDEIAGILGLDRDILDITIGDLYAKSLAYPSSNKCYMMNEGRTVLKSLEASKKETDILRNIYVNAVNQDLIKEINDIALVRIVDDDHKIRHSFDGNKIEFYRNKIGEIKEIFNKENEIYSSDSNYIPDELISIDEVEDIQVCFLKIPVLIYVSETGTDLDLISSDKRLSELLDSVKADVLEQIRKHKLLKRVFTKYIAKEVAKPPGEFADMDKLKGLINKYVTDSENKSNNYDLIEKMVFSNRVLIDRELEKLFELCLKTTRIITIYLDNLDYWSKNSKFITMLTLIPLKTKYVIYYDNVVMRELAEKRIVKAVPGISKEDIKEYSHSDWFKIVFEDSYQIIGCPKNYKAVDSDTWIVRIKYYLQTLN